ncbi:Heat shock transcription factor [Coemansia biformis]|uniref:Heat shock transcription factor n=1 Tax=Coemansia biformis TaxID=1286918 RepID=A0A9W8D0E3_9FUNG|nr:Heat shock transcription factor [Coemansia biformis]
MNGLVSRRATNLHRNITVTPFLNKLYNMVDDSASDDHIRWSAEGNSFVVVRHEDFAKEVLPRFFKHNNFSSFVRQLNMYGFHKVPHLQQGGLMADSPDAESWEFSNENFQRGQPDLLHFIRRKKGNKDSAAAAHDAAVDLGLANDDTPPVQDSDGDGDDGGFDDAEALPSAESVATAIAAAVSAAATTAPSQAYSGTATEQQPAKNAPPVSTKSAEPGGIRARASRTPAINISKVLKEIQVIRDHQMTISSDIKQLQGENQSLWMQARTTEERYIKHQKTIDKILRFLATVYSADARYSEIRPPLRRLISHSAQPRSDDGGDSSADEHSVHGSSTPWVQSVFEEMDFPDSLSAGQPPDKRRRTEERSRPANIYEMPPDAATPARATDQQARHAGAADPSDCERSMGRKAQNPHQPSTALTRIQPWNLLASPPPSRRAPSDTVLSGSRDNSRLKAQSESINQLSEKVDSLGHSLESLTRQLNSGLLSQLLASQQSLPAGTIALAGGPDPTTFASSVMPRDVLANISGPLTTASLGMSPNDLEALLATDALGSLELPLGGVGLLPSSQAQLPVQQAGPSMPSGADIAPFLGASHSTPGAVLATDPASSGPTQPAGSSGSNYEDAGLFDGLALNSLQNMLKSTTSKDYQRLMQSLLEMANDPTDAHLLAGGDASGGADDLHNPGASPFLDFVDPNADAGVANDSAAEASPTGSNASGAATP